MATEFFPAAAALNHNFNVNFDEEWAGEMKGLLLEADWEMVSDVRRVCFCVAQLRGNKRSFACKLWPTLHVQIIYSGRGKLSNCNKIALPLDNRNSANKIAKCD